MQAAPHARGARGFRGFLGALVLTVLVLGGLMLALNRLVDPLWHFQGNQLTGTNLVLNERQSKLNQLLRNPDAYDCLIFGTSRTTLMHTAAFRQNRCFNLAFSAGQPREFVAYARYLAHMGIEPEVVYVAIDARNMRTALPPPDVPPHVATLGQPRHWLVDYLSVDSVLFSVRTLVDASSLVRRYDSDFQAIIGPHGPYRIPGAVTAHGIALAPDAARPWVRLADIFPQARMVGYVPPLAGWRCLRELTPENLETYLSTLRRIAMAYDRVVDFSVPSPVTQALDNTYDGSHYDLAVNARVARRLETGTDDPDEAFGVTVDPRRLQDLRDAWQAGFQSIRAHTRLIE